MNQSIDRAPAPRTASPSPLKRGPTFVNLNSLPVPPGHQLKAGRCFPTAPGLSAATVGPPRCQSPRSRHVHDAAVTLKLITGSACLCAWALQETSAQTRNVQVWGPGALFLPCGPAARLPVPCQELLCVRTGADFFVDTANLGSNRLNGPIWLGSRSWLPLSFFCLGTSLSLLMQCVPDPRNGTRMGGHGQEGCTTLPSLFLSSTCGLSPSNGSPLPPQASWSRPKSFISIGLAALGLGRTATLFINPINALQKSLSFDVSDTTTLTCTNVLQNGSWLPQLAIPSCIILR